MTGPDLSIPCLDCGAGEGDECHPDCCGRDVWDTDLNETDDWEFEP